MSDKGFKNSQVIAISGITVALGVVIMMATAFPSLSYAVPMVAGGVLIVPVAELGAKRSIPIYIATFLISLFNPVVQKDASLLYVTLFGIYPVIQFSFERIKVKPVRILLKLLYFNAAAFSATFAAFKLFGIPVTDDGDGSLIIIGLIILLNVFFLIYDLALYKFAYLYDKKYSARFRKLFNIH